MSKKDKIMALLQYLPLKDQNLAVQCLKQSNWETLKEIVDSDMILMKRLYDDKQVSQDIIDGLDMLKITLDDFIDQYNIDIPYVDYEEI